MIVATKDPMVGRFGWYLDAFLNKFVGDKPVLAEITGFQQSNSGRLTTIVHIGSTKVIRF